MYSLSHMAKAGTEGYIEDLCWRPLSWNRSSASTSRWCLYRTCSWQAARARCQIRTAAEVTAWAAKTYGEEGSFLSSSFRLANYLLSPRMWEVGQPDYERLVRLPTSAKWPSNKACWVMSGFDLPWLSIPPRRVRKKK
jgi:hypothetical protein